MAATTTSLAAAGIVNEPLTRDNYDSWSSLVKNYLKGEGLWDLIAPSSDPNDKDNGEKNYSKALRKDNFEQKNFKALHIIQLACGSAEILTKIRKCETAKEAWNTLAALYSPQINADRDHIVGGGDLDHHPTQIRQLHRYVESGDWDNAEAIINRDVTAAIKSTSSTGRSVLHVAVIAGHQKIVENLVKLGKDKLVKMQDNLGYTALALAAKFTGNVNIAKCMVERKGGLDLLTIKTKDDQDHEEIPILLSAAWGHKEMTDYLYKQMTDYLYKQMSDPDADNPCIADLLLTRCITAEIFDVAFKLIHDIPDLLPAHKSDNLLPAHESDKGQSKQIIRLPSQSDGSRPLYALACIPSAFRSGCGFGRRERLIYNILRLERSEVKLQKLCRITIQIAQSEDQHNTSFAGPALNFLPVKLLVRLLIFVRLWLQNCILLKVPGIREIYEQKKTHLLVSEILTGLCQKISEYNHSELQEASAYNAMLQAAKLGIIEFIDAMRMANPDLLWVTDKNKRGIFAHAILNRKENVFIKLINKVKDGRKEIIKYHADSFGNTLLHLAGHLGPSSDLDCRSGPALQMQRELQWFKAVEKIVHPKCKEQKNIDGKKPREIFSEKHEEMVKAGEKWAKDTAKSFTLVGTLITTIMFAAAFTVPGGNNQQTGVPIFSHNHIFTSFIIADAISLFASSAAVLLFIRILTARYSEKDFLKTLPLNLLLGLVALFLSVAAMVVAFCASLAMMLNGYQRLIIVGAMSLGSVPVIVLLLQFKLFRQILDSTIYKVDIK